MVIDTTGRGLLSRRVVNDESALLELIAAVLTVADGDRAVRATDLNSGGAALLIALLTEHGQRLLYIPGRIVHHAAQTYRGDGKTDAKTPGHRRPGPDAHRPAAGAGSRPDQH